MPTFVALMAEIAATLGSQLALEVGSGHPNGTLCICRPNRTLWYSNGGLWQRVTLS